MPTSQICWAEKQWQKIGDVCEAIYLDEASNDSGSRHTVFHVESLTSHERGGEDIERLALDIGRELGVGRAESFTGYNFDVTMHVFYPSYFLSIYPT